MPLPWHTLGRQAGRWSTLGWLAGWPDEWLCGAWPARVDGLQDGTLCPPSAALGPPGSLRPVLFAAPRKAPPCPALGSGSHSAAVAQVLCASLPSRLFPQPPPFSLPAPDCSPTRFKHHLQAGLHSCSRACQGPSPEGEGFPEAAYIPLYRRENGGPTRGNGTTSHSPE